MRCPKRRHAPPHCGSDFVVVARMIPSPGDFARHGSQRFPTAKRKVLKFVVASASEAIHRATDKEEWIASSRLLLAMTRAQFTRTAAISPRDPREFCNVKRI